MPGNRRTSNEDRARIVEAHLQGEDFVALAATLRIKRSTAYSIVRCYQQNNRTNASHSGGRPKLIDNETLDLIVMLIEANPLISLKEMKEEVRQVWPAKPYFSEVTLSRALQGELITLKMVRDAPDARNSFAVKEARHSYAEWMLATGLQQHRVYIDETGFNLWTRRTYGRARRGERVNRIVGGQRGGNVTVIAAISDQFGLFYHEIHVGSVTSNTFNDFIASFEAILGDERPVIIMDNAPIHRGITTIYPELDFRFLPPYSPFLNPIENCFSVFKSYIKRFLHEEVGQCTPARAMEEGVTLATLRENIIKAGVGFAINRVQDQIVRQNYQHANSYLVKCIERQDIFN